MKILIAAALACFTALAAAQGTTEPGQTVQPAPDAGPVRQVPTEDYNKMEPPKPLPWQTAPVKPAPAAPAPAEPAPAAQPPEPGKLIPIDTTIQPASDRITSPSAASFRPFVSTAAAMSSAEQRLENKLATQPDRVAELKQKHTAELKALRLNMQDRPNAEIRKAVSAREAEQKKELKALQAAIKAEAEKHQKPRNRVKSKTLD